uniref:hypothetical protein n=1 Tax=Lactococcus garvieae TaxID=1363 RepID=UPI00359C22AD
MTQTNEEFYAVVAEVLLDDPTSREPKIHIAREKMKKGTVQKQLRDIILDYKEAEVDVDIKPYQEALSRLQKMKENTGEYEQLLEEILYAYAPEKVERVPQKLRVNPVVS